MIYRLHYIPESGDVVWPEFDPQAGLMVCCPVSTRIKGCPFEVLTDIEGVPSAILSDHVKSLDCKVRRARNRA